MLTKLPPGFTCEPHWDRRRQGARYVLKAPSTTVGSIGTKVTTSGSDCSMNWSEVMMVCTGASKGLFNPKRATTYGSMFVTTDADPPQSLISHEAKHADQYLLFGGFSSFGPLYGLSELLPGCNPFEIWAGRKHGC